MTSPNWRTPKFGLRYALDNGAWAAFCTGVAWDSDAYMKWLDRHLSLDTVPDFAICPDIVGDGNESLDHSCFWRTKLPNSIKWYLAVQDGMSQDDARGVIDKFDGIFVGGTTDWKIKTGQDWVGLAHSLDLPIHVGRVGSPERMRWAESIGVDSIDSTTPAQNAKQNPMRYLIHTAEEVKGIHHQPELFAMEEIYVGNSDNQTAL